MGKSNRGHGYFEKKSQRQNLEVLYHISWRPIILVVSGVDDKQSSGDRYELHGYINFFTGNIAYFDVTDFLGGFWNERKLICLFFC